MSALSLCAFLCAKKPEFFPPAFSFPMGPTFLCSSPLSVSVHLLQPVSLSVSKALRHFILPSLLLQRRSELLRRGLYDQCFHSERITDLSPDDILICPDAQFKGPAKLLR